MAKFTCICSRRVSRKNWSSKYLDIWCVRRVAKAESDYLDHLEGANLLDYRLPCVLIDLWIVLAQSEPSWPTKTTGFLSAVRKRRQSDTVYRHFVSTVALQARMKFNRLVVSNRKKNSRKKADNRSTYFGNGNEKIEATFQNDSAKKHHEYLECGTFFVC